MGVDYHVYVGPYIEIKAKELTQTVSFQYRGCTNSICNKKDTSQVGNFCSQCGQPITLIDAEEEEQVDVYEALENLKIENLDPGSEDKDYIRLYPNHDELVTVSANIKYDGLSEDLSNLDIQEEIDKVKVLFSKELRLLEETYGAKPVIKWGIFSNVG